MLSVGTYVVLVSALNVGTIQRVLKNFFFLEILEPWTNFIIHGLRLSCSSHTPLLLHIHFPLRTTSNPSTSISHFTSRSPNEPSRVFTFNFVLARPRRPTLSLFTSPTRHLRPPGKRPKFTSNIRFLACFHIPFLKKCQFSRFTFRAKVRRGGPCMVGSRCQWQVGSDWQVSFFTDFNKFD